MHFSVTPALQQAIPVIWAAGYGATVLGVVSIIWSLSLVDMKLLFRAVIITATLGALISALGVLKLMGVPVIRLDIFESESRLLYFVSFLNLPLYGIIFFWMANRAFADAAERIEAARKRNIPFERARAAESAGDLQEAISFYLKHLAEHRDDYDAVMHYGVCLTRVGRFKEAIEAFRKITDRQRGLRGLAAGVEIVHVLEARIGDPKAAEKEIEVLRKKYTGTPLESELEGRLRESRRRPPNV